jgi:hypothetical protein
MVGSIERLRRHIRVASFAPMMMLVIGVRTTSDPTKRIGTAGVIAIPATVPAPSNSGARGDMLPGEARRDSRADHVRVLYAPGHAPRDTAAVSARPIRNQACVDQQAVRGRARHPAPNS